MLHEPASHLERKRGEKTRRKRNEHESLSMLKISTGLREGGREEGRKEGEGGRKAGREEGSERGEREK